MLKNHFINLKVIEKLALALGELNNEVVYVGGAVVSLYVTDEGAEQARPTTDIDIAVQVSSYAQMDQLRERLSTKKIYPAPMEQVLYRYKYEDITIDFIPHEASPLGPTNSWLKPGIKHAIIFETENTSIRIMPVCYFLASKWEAYNNRGSDPRTSPDFEDIIFTLDNNSKWMHQLKTAGPVLKNYLIQLLKFIKNHPSCVEIIECHMNPFTASARRHFLLERISGVLKS